MPTNTILVIGGAGYIGSHMVDRLRRENKEVIVLDDLSTGHRDAVQGAHLIVGNMHDSDLLETIFTQHQISAVMHFGAFIQVGESVLNPAKYYHNNFVATLNLLQVMLRHQVKYFIFSSTAAVYGEPRYTPIDENHPIAPINPYGRSKWMVEQVLRDYAESYGLKYAALRYFNAAGADPEGKLAERHDPETHLIPLVLQVASGEREAITIYGNDYPTPDGTCVRDYVHVSDLCEAHLVALQKLWEGSTSFTYNLGCGEGYSVQEVIDAARMVTGKDIPIIIGKRREGDPAVLVANPRLAMQELAWTPRYASLETIIRHTWNSHLFSTCPTA